MSDSLNHERTEDHRGLLKLDRKDLERVDAQLHETYQSRIGIAT